MLNGVRGVTVFFKLQVNSPRSKTVILVKNLPAGTESGEIMKLFQEHGTVSRLLLPPSGITALVEMLDPSEAKRAFRNLAYLKVCLDSRSNFDFFDGVIYCA